MRFIISPAKKMNVDGDTMEAVGRPVFLERAEVLKGWLQGQSKEELQRLWGCNEKIAELNYGRLRGMDLEKGVTPAVLAYEGIQYQYMAPRVFEAGEWEYVEEYVRILSGFYGRRRGIQREREICMISGRMPSMGSCGRRRIVL